MAILWHATEEDASRVCMRWMIMMDTVSLRKWRSRKSKRNGRRKGRAVPGQYKVFIGLHWVLVYSDFAGVCCCIAKMYHVL